MVKILAVDDMLQWRNYHSSALRVILSDVEYELSLVESATLAFELIEQNLDEPYNLVITDLQMEEAYEPEYAGEWLARNIKSLKQYTNTPIIIVSAAYNIKFIAEQLGVDCIPKPSLIHNQILYELKIREALNC